jgi:cell division initiation protein
MALTPLDVLQRQLQPARRAGYEPEDVHNFLNEVREAWEQALEDNQRLQDDIRLRDADIALLRQEQEEIRETLVMARRISVESEAHARREADLLVGEARLEAQSILTAAYEEQRRLQEQLVRLKSLRLQHIAQLKALLELSTQVLYEVERTEL